MCKLRKPIELFLPYYFIYALKKIKYKRETKYQIPSPVLKRDQKQHKPPDIWLTGCGS